jgi:predicted AAA+ superfamily ATPase
MSGRGVSNCFQVCWTVENKDTLEREIKGLLGALHAYKLDEGIILTKDEHADLQREGNKICIRPVWHFALNAQKTNMH